MPEVMEYPWNGIILDGGSPAASVPGFTAARNVRHIGVRMDPRVVMPVGTTSIPAGVQTWMVDLADAAETAGCLIAWGINGCLEPVSETSSRRPTVGWLTDFWSAVDAVVGSHAATWGHSLLTAPTMWETGPSNGDPDPAMATWSDYSWSDGSDPSVAAGPWLQTLTSEAVFRLRNAGCSTRIIVPLLYLEDPDVAHPDGPWVYDSAVWYGASVSPMGVDHVHATKTYAEYLSDAVAESTLYRGSWIESVYTTKTPGHVSVVDSIELNPPDLVAIPEEVPVVPPLPVSDLAASPLNGGALLTWTAPADLGSEPFLYYRITDGTDEWRADSEGAEIELANDINHTLTVTVVTGNDETETPILVESPSDTVSVTPTAASPGASGPWLPALGTDEGPQIAYPGQPLHEAFPQDRNFRPGNFMRTADQVEEGL